MASENNSALGREIQSITNRKSSCVKEVVVEVVAAAEAAEAAIS